MLNSGKQPPQLRRMFRAAPPAPKKG